MPSPQNYNHHGMATAQGKRPIGHGDARMSSFGFGRDRMQKLHIDAILYENLRGKNETFPGPGSHDISIQWKTPADRSVSKTTPQYSFSKSRKDSKEHFNMQVHKRADDPGPGNYATPLDVPVLQNSNKRYHRTGYGKRTNTQTM